MEQNEMELNETEWTRMKLNEAEWNRKRNGIKHYQNKYKPMETDGRSELYLEQSKKAAHYWRKPNL